ncbi:MAG: hypothetical protein FWE69_08655 [Clostridiales bacterium]|nr:hypothetical protein [Clostridiales bacterium]
MSFFRRRNNVSTSAPESLDAETLLEQHKRGEMDDNTFLIAFGKADIFYSTPFGDHKDGGSRLFALPDKDNTGFLPVFISAERASGFYDKAGRCGFLVMEGSFKSFLEITRGMNRGKTPVKLGAVIEPGYYGITVGASMLDAAIRMMK